MKIRKKIIKIARKLTKKIDLHHEVLKGFGISESRPTAMSVTERGRGTDTSSEDEDEEGDGADHDEEEDGLYEVVGIDAELAFLRQ